MSGEAFLDVDDELDDAHELARRFADIAVEAEAPAVVVFAAVGLLVGRGLIAMEQGPAELDVVILAIGNLAKGCFQNERAGRLSS